jgi:hypothetical protein
LKTVSPEGIVLQDTGDTERNLILKRDVISKYLFNMAFENVLDPGYVTEKPWDALLAGRSDSLVLYGESFFLFSYMLDYSCTA